jgi:3-oxoacyl-[acyl-carrier-protein] synthase-3
VSLHLHGLGHFNPENEITNAFLEELDIGTNDEWILERVGIRSRRTTLPLDYIRQTHNRDPRAALEATLYTHADTGRRAAEMAIARAGIDKSAIGMVIAGSSAMDTATPAEACNVARALELEVPALDVNSACTSFFANLFMLSLMDPAKLPEFVLVVVPEAVTRTVDYDDRSSAVLWGDGAVAAVLSTRVPGRAEILDSTLQSSPAGADKVVVPRVGHFRQHGRAVQMFAIRKTIEQLGRLRDAYAEGTRRFHFVGHQANLRMLDAVRRECEIPEDRHHSNVEWYGNTAGAAAPSVVSMRWDEWRADDDVAVVGVGAGLTWSSYLMRFTGGNGATAATGTLERSAAEDRRHGA